MTVLHKTKLETGLGPAIWKGGYHVSSHLEGVGHFSSHLEAGVLFPALLKRGVMFPAIW